MSKRTGRVSRRGMLGGMLAGAGALSLPSLLGKRDAVSAPSEEKPPRFLIVIGAFGGASIIDSFLPITHSESANYQSINCFDDGDVVSIPDSPIRAPIVTGNLLATPISSNLVEFAGKHKQDMMVATMTGTSVNHTVAQKRSITGNGGWAGRTMQELVALEYGEGCPMPNVNMSSLGFLEHGDDPTLPAYCYNEPVSVPNMWPLALDGMRGIKGLPDRDFVEMAKALRNQKLDPESSFYSTFQLNEKLQRWKRQRNQTQPDLEAADLISKLNLLTEDQAPLAEFGLSENPDAALLQQTFPSMHKDPLEAQAAMAYLLIRNRASVAVTIGPNFNITLDDETGSGIILNPPLSYDNSHTDHRKTQAFMWSRLLRVADRLIDLLKAVEFDSATGESFWDRSMIYFATDFGRSKGRPIPAGGGVSANFGSMHDLNNGVLAVSPMVNGNTVLGAVNPDDGMTYGFDGITGLPTDPSHHMGEKEIFGGIVQAMGVSTTGSSLPDMPVMRRGG